VPSAGNAEPISPTNRQAVPLDAINTDTTTATTSGSATGTELSPNAPTNNSDEPTGPRSTISPEGKSTDQVPSPANSQPTSPSNQQTAGPANANPFASSDSLLQSRTPTTGRAPGQPMVAETQNPAALTSGGTARPDSRSGAAGNTLESCMAVWEPATHMSKDLWRRTCQRTLNDPVHNP
jgi:hypothetical protein